MSFIYIGRFSPEGGGVTNKNKLLFLELSELMNIDKIDLTQIKKGNIRVLIKLCVSLLSRKSAFIIGTAAKARKALTHFLYIFNNKSLKQSVLIVMGGQFGSIVASDFKYTKWIKQYKMIYVETQQMNEVLNSVGVYNVSVFPNCRVRPSVEIPVNHNNGRLKCICFSMIYSEKGIDTVLEAAKHLPDVDFDFRGHINDDYRKEFIESVDNLANCSYSGVFKVDNDNVYQMLNKYDVLLFPTRCIGEGVPGTIVESKIAALPAIVSNVAYNASLVEDGVSGIVMKENTASCLVDAISRLDKKRDLLDRLKVGAKKSGENYYFDNYKQSIYEALFDECN